MSDLGKAWSEAEVRFAVKSYLKMLKLELAHLPYVKSQENAALRQLLNGRSKGSVEFKLQNISAVLVRSGRAPIRGYKPASNSQGLLAQAVEDGLRADPALNAAATEAFDPEAWSWFSR